MKIAELISLVRSSEAERTEAISIIHHDKDLRAKVYSHVFDNSGDKEDAQILYDDMIVQFVKTAFNGNVKNENVDAHAYLMGVARFTWLGRLKRSSRMTHAPIDEAMVIVDQKHQPDQLFFSVERRNVLAQILDNLRSNCKETLMHWASGYSMKEIASKLNYKSEAMARKKKSQCMKQLLTFLDDNPRIKERLA